MASALGARDLFRLFRGLDVGKVNAGSRKPFRFLLCGDPALVAELRALLLHGHPDDVVPLDAAACLEAFAIPTPPAADPRETRVAMFLGRRGDLASANVASLRSLGVPIFAITVDPEALPSGPPAPPAAGTWAEYVVPSLERDALRGRVFPHIVTRCKNVEIAVGRRLPAMRETVAAQLTRDAANTALKVALASAVVDHIPVVGIVLGAFASAGDMVAITGIQMMLLLHIEATYGRDPDVQRMWQLLPVIGGGFGWRTIARELAGFVPVAGIAIKGAIAYAGTIVVGEGVTFLHEHGRHMNKAQAAQLYARTKDDAMTFARQLIGKLKPR
ncbi:MAG TPA: hypothetical protein VIJ12_05210 [Candidatus Baltobacteraceae bacterium]